MARKRKTGTGADADADIVEAVEVDPILPWPTSGGSYIRDSDTGALTPNPAETPESED